MRVTSDTGGTFTDVIIEDDDGTWALYKASTTPTDPVIGVLGALKQAASSRNMSLRELLSRVDMFIHGTTFALNAIVEGKTARTAFLTTVGHREILVLREGGRQAPFNRSVPYPEPYIPRALTFEIPGRIDASGAVVEPFDRAAALAVLDRVRSLEIEAIGVCLLWCIRNPAHEIMLGHLIAEQLPQVPYTLSHQLNPTVREYRRASSTCIDASLKPLMRHYVARLFTQLKEAGFSGRLLMMTSQGGMIDYADVAAAPIHAINSGPSLAPVAGLRYAAVEGYTGNVIIADTGGTTYDVSLIRNQQIPVSQECWIGSPHTGHMTGFPSVDIKSVGAGGGSIAWLDSGGVLHVGPQSAGALPGPVCYGAGGDRPTVTDACVVLGFIDPDYFLDGTMKLDREAAAVSIQTKIAVPLGLSLQHAASAIVEVATENMVQVIVDLTVNQGIDPKGTMLIGGGGAAGLNSTLIARRLGCDYLLFPELGPALSAAGGMLSNLTSDFRESFFASTAQFDCSAVNALLARLAAKAQAYVLRSGVDAGMTAVRFAVDARYENEAWTIETPLACSAFGGTEDIARLVEDFHRCHETVFGVRDERSEVEILNWRAQASCELTATHIGHIEHSAHDARSPRSRRAYFRSTGEVDTTVFQFGALVPGERFNGPAIVETPFTTIIVDARARFWRTEHGNLLVVP